MVHRTQITKRIWTNEVVYRTSPLGNLDRTTCVSGIFPLQEGFDSDSQRRFSIGIDNLTAFAFEQGIVGAMPISQSTAMATPFGSMPTIHDVQSDVVIKASLLENLPEFIKRNAHNSPVEPSALSLESLKLLDGYAGIESVSDFNDFSDHLSEIGLDKISFPMFQYFEFLFGIQRLESCPSLNKLFPSNPNVLSKISLIQNLSFWRNHADSKMLGIYINSHDVFSLLDFLLLGYVCNNLQVFSQTESFAYPTAFNQILESLVVSVAPDGNGNSVSWIQSKFNKEIGLCIEGLAVSWNVELDCQPVNFISFLSPSIPNQTASDLNVERGVFLAS